jgi:ABC-2 type transport system ATP-binding protein
MIQVRSLSKKYGSKQVLDSIDLNFEAGKVYGIVGENGAGKTTLFRCIAGLENYDGAISSELTPLKNYMGLLLTEQFFFPKITGREYLRFLCHARGKSMENIEQRNVFDLPLDQYAVTYSTGMKKKLALTGILLQENECYILDEPFNGVDIQSNIIITEIILRLKEMKKTVIISSHIFSTLSDTCDEIHLLQTGKMVKSVEKHQFSELEAEMKQVIVGDKLEKLGLK